MSSRAPIPSWAFTVRQNVNIVRRRRVLFGLIAPALLVGALTADQLWPKMYSSTADLVTQPIQIQVPGLQAGSGGLVAVSELEYMQTQVEIATSFNVLTKVAQAEGLVGNDEALKTPTDQLQEFVHQVEIELHLKSEILSPDQVQLAEAVSLLKSRVSASVVKDSYVLELKVSTRDPHLSQRIAKRLITEYLTASNTERLAQLDAAQTVLQQQIDDAKKRVDNAQADLVAFDKKHGTATQSVSESTTSNVSKDGTRISTKTNSTQSTNSNVAARAPLEWALQVQQTRYQSLIAQQDLGAVEKAAIEGQVSLTNVLNDANLNSQPDGIDRKYRFLIYLLLAPLLAIGAIYVVHYFEIYRRTAPALAAVRRA
jgi:uncharacterized protein involved in exopolysaccharide biosynthesis